MHRSPPRRSFRSLRGFTILEVALAAFVLALGLATSIIALQSGYKFIDVARDSTLASQILQSEIERIRLMSWARVCALPPEEQVFLSSMYLSDHSTDPTADAALNSRLEGRFLVRRKVEPDPARPTEVRLITVSVKWTSFFERPYERRFVATYVQNGLYDYYYSLAGP